MRRRRGREDEEEEEERRTKKKEEGSAACARVFFGRVSFRLGLALARGVDSLSSLQFVVSLSLIPHVAVANFSHLNGQPTGGGLGRHGAGGEGGVGASKERDR